MAAPDSLTSIINKFVESSTGINIQSIANQVYGLLIENINSADMPEGARSQILAAVSAPQILSPTHAAIHIGSVMKPSMFQKGNGGLLKDGKRFQSKYGDVDLVLVYNKRKAPKKTYYPVDVVNDKVKWAKMNGDQVKAYRNNFLQKTVTAGNALVAPYGGSVTLV